MTVAPARSIMVADTSYRGRKSHDEIEGSTPAGKALHWIEERVFAAARLVTRFRDSWQRETLLDGDCDRAVDDAIAALDAGDGIQARALLLAYKERDALRDAEHHDGAAHVYGIHDELKRLGGFVERSCVAIRELARKGMGR